jgi:tRNA nucleotidyltransferase (CCA-adding enzyme)
MIGNSDFQKKKILESILEEPSLRNRKLKKISEIEGKLNQIKKKESLNFEIFLGGSIAKGTDIRGSDVDVFLLFPEEYDPMRILKILKREFPNGREEYSEHPYLLIRQKSFSVDIVPGYKASSASDLKTAVDRTPFHVEFVQKNFTPEMKMEARIMKQFMKGIGVYGAESSVQGFSGYVAELLIYRYRTFENVISDARGWGIPQHLDKDGKEFKDANLVLIDPVDSDRNTAANVSIENLATFILASTLFSWDNGMEFFFPEKGHYEIPRNAVAIYFPCKKCNEQVLVPNLRRVSSVLKKELENIGFRTQYSSVFVDGAGYIILIPEAEQLGEAVLHVGPPVTSRNVGSFLDKWGRGTRYGMPFMVGERVCVLREREGRSFIEAVLEILPRTKLSGDFSSRKMVVISGEELSSLPDHIRKNFISPSLGKWISSVSGNVERNGPES